MESLVISAARKDMIQISIVRLSESWGTQPRFQREAWKTRPDIFDVDQGIKTSFPIVSEGR
jgi:hypothetical protein